MPPEFLWTGLVPAEMRGDGCTTPSDIAVEEPGDPGLPGIIWRRHPDVPQWERRRDSGEIAAIILAREVASLRPDAGRWAGLREAVRVVCMGMGHDLPQTDDDLAVLVANALMFTATVHRAGLVDGPPLAWRKDDAGWGLVVVLPQGISSLGDVMRIDTLEEWRWAIHEPFDHGYVGSPEEALGEMRKRLPGWKIPDMPAELLHFSGA